MNGEHRDFDHVFEPAQRLNTLQEAQDAVRFTAVAPEALGEPISIYDHPGADPAYQALAFIYQHPQLGRFVVIEFPSDGTQADIEAYMHTCDPNLGECRMVDLADGSAAYLSVGLPQEPHAIVEVIWLRGGVLFRVAGPAESFTKDAAVAVANAVAKATPSR